MELFNDDRFSAVAKDPRFRQVPKQERKVKIDKRFQGMFTDKRFKLKYSVDKRGRPETQSAGENLKKFYELEESDDDSEEDEDDEDEDDEEEGDRDQGSVTKNSKSESLESGKSKMSRRRSGRELLLEYRRRKAQSQDTARNSVSKLGSKKSVEKETSNNFFGTGEGEAEEESDLSDDESEEDESGLGSDDSGTRILDTKKSSTEAGPSWKKRVGIDLARGEGNVETSSSEDSDSDDEADQSGAPRQYASHVIPLTDDLSHKWGELDADAPREEATSHRLAICNMDWDSVTASDLLILLNSFKPTGGLIHSVKIYPSEFGLERMAEEDAKGPQELVESNEREKRLEGFQQGKYHMEKLRKYQFQRLKYYYAVVECDSAATANNIYEQCDGMEYETTSSKLDLRFIPDDTVFEHKPKDVATDLPDTASYKPVDFQTTALTQSRVQLTWDETDRRRAKQTAEVFQSKKKVEALESHMQAYLASSSSEEEEEEEGDGDGEEDKEDDSSEEEEEEAGDDAKNPKSEKRRIDRYRSLLKGIEEKEKQEKEDRDMEMEISWEPGLKETTQEIVKKKAEGSGSTPWEQYLDKKKEKKKERKEQRKKSKGTPDMEDEEEEQAFSDDELPEGVDLSDSFFKDSLKDMGRKGTKSKGTSKLVEGGKTEEDLQEEKQRKAALELLMLDEKDDGKQHFNLKSIMESETMTKSKRKRQLKQQRKQGQTEDSAPPASVQDNFEINTADPRFEALFTSHAYAIDPSNPQFKKTKAMSKLITEKQKRRKDTEEDEDAPVVKEKRKNGSANVELSQLVKSIKNKTEQYHSRKKLKGDL